MSPIELIEYLERFKKFHHFNQFYEMMYHTEKQNMIIDLDKRYTEYGLTHDEFLLFMYFNDKSLLFDSVNDYFKMYISTDYIELEHIFKA